MQEGCISVLAQLLVLNDDCDLEMVNGVLHALENILEAGAAEAAVEAAADAANLAAATARSTAPGRPPERAIAACILIMCA